MAPAARIVLRTSGPRAVLLAQDLAPGVTMTPASATEVFLAFADLRCPAWLYVFRAPRSYTGGDTVEYHLPGSPVLARLLLDELLRRGARLAEPGEFTARAFFAGRLTLTEAEGVAATIAAGNEAELRAARQLLAGELARRLRPVLDELATTLALVEVGIDFSEEEVTFLAADEVRRRATAAGAALGELVDDAAQFESLSHEPRVVLAGRPNAGKSSLLNALAGHDRAVVTDVAGTTRDVLSAGVDLPHGRITLIDVAGLDETDGGDPIADQMQSHARAALRSADHVLLVQDVSDRRISVPLPTPPDCVVWTKADLVGKHQRPLDGVCVSVRTDAGLDDLRHTLDALCFVRGTRSTLALNRRHLAGLADARAALDRLLALPRPDAELVATDLRDAIDALGSVLGTVTPDDVLGRIFAGFCIGK